MVETKREKLNMRERERERDPMHSNILLCLTSNCWSQTTQTIYGNMELGVVHLRYDSQIQRNIWCVYNFLDTIEVTSGGDICLYL